MDNANPVDVFGQAGTLLQRNAASCMAAGFVYLIVNIVLAIPSFVVQTAIEDGFGLGGEPSIAEALALLGFGLTIMTVQVVVGAVLSLGLGNFALRLVDHGEADVGNLIPDVRMIPAAISAGVASSFLMTLGILACCVGVFVAYPCTLFWSFFILDRRGGGIAAIQDGVRLIRDKPGANIAFGVILMALAGINALACCYLASIVVIPFLHLSCALAYRQVFPAQPLLDQG
jgi:uncharacterized membrane protein